MNLRWNFFDRFTDLGLLIIRVGLGLMFLLHHGWPKLVGGPDMWAGVGRAVSHLGIHFGYAFWGFIAAMVECVGGLCLVLGLAARPAALLLALEMCVAAIWKFYPFVRWSAADYPFELAIVFFGLFFIGPGKHSLDANL